MKVFSISDLHLSSLLTKPMDVFGEAWNEHFDKIKKDWQSKVCDDDIVLICGDISWGMNLKEGLADLHLLAELKGKKVFCRGNHDYWWSGITKLRDNAPNQSFHFLQNDCVKFENVVICGSRGWACPGANDYSEHDEKLYLREAERFKLCANAVSKVREENDVLLVMMHYPPFSLKCDETLFTQQFEQMKADKVIFGHVHGEAYFPLRSYKNGIEYLLTSCDKVNFSLQRIL